MVVVDAALRQEGIHLLAIDAPIAVRVDSCELLGNPLGLSLRLILALATSSS